MQRLENILSYNIYFQITRLPTPVMIPHENTVCIVRIPPKRELSRLPLKETAGEVFKTELVTL